MADEDKHAIDGHFAGRARFHIAQLYVLHHAVALDALDDRIPDEANLLIGEGALLQRRPGAQFVAPVDDGHLVGELGQEDTLFQGAIAAADHGHILAAEEEAVARATIADAAADVFRLAGHCQMLRRRSGGHDDRFGAVRLAMGFHGEGRAVQKIDLGHLFVDHPRAEMLGLPAHQLNHLRAGRRGLGVKQAGVILYLAGEGNLAAELQAGEDDRFQQRPRGINSRRQSGRAGANDHDSFLLHTLLNSGYRPGEGAT